MSEAKLPFDDVVADRHRRVGEIIAKHLAEMRKAPARCDPAGAELRRLPAIDATKKGCRAAAAGSACSAR